MVREGRLRTRAALELVAARTQCRPEGQLYLVQRQLDNFSKPDIDLRANGRVDITRQTKVDFEGRFSLLADNPGDPNLPTAISKPPLYTITGGTVGIRHAFNRLELSLKGTIDSTDYRRRHAQ